MLRSESLRKALQRHVSGELLRRHWIPRLLFSVCTEVTGGVCELKGSRDAVLSFHWRELMGLNGAVMLEERKKPSFIHLLAGERLLVRNQVVLEAIAALAEPKTVCGTWVAGIRSSLSRLHSAST